MALTLDGDNGISGINGSAATPAVQGTDTNTGLTFGTDTVGVVTNGTTRATVDSNGRLLVNTTSSTLGQIVAYKSGSGFQAATPQLTLQNAATDGGGADGPGINFANATGSVANIAASGNGQIFFSNRSASTGSWGERMRIISDGTAFVAKTGYALGTAGHELQSNGVAYHTSSTARVIIANKLGADGILVGFYHETVEEGNISVSGSTVSYNGAHLSRWSQLAGNAERIEILRGSVLSNLDEMCEWGEEDNEQLNRMKVSDVEGDPNVAGVFQGWDDDDDTYTNDFYCAMTGDFVIRIAQGVTVERGDLLMSAGDGTAKPQDDDIIRSKTIAKVTSTNVSCTYDDGSFCVPCVLMAC